MATSLLKLLRLRILHTSACQNPPTKEPLPIKCESLEFIDAAPGYAKEPTLKATVTTNSTGFKCSMKAESGGKVTEVDSVGTKLKTVHLDAVQFTWDTDAKIFTDAEPIDAQACAVVYTTGNSAAPSQTKNFQ